MEENILRVETKCDVTVVYVTEKRIYRDVVDPFQKKMVSLLDEGRQKIIIDLSQVDVMNSLGLGLGMGQANKRKWADGGLRFVSSVTGTFSKNAFEFDF